MRNKNKLENIHGSDPNKVDRYHGGIVKIIEEHPQLSHCVLVQKIMSKKGIPSSEKIKRKLFTIARYWLKVYDTE